MPDPLYTYLSMTTGSRPGATYLLSTTGETLIGRGLECAISLKDPLCSRVHAIVQKEEDERWCVRDAGSRNGTFVNGQKIDEAVLDPDHRLRVGSTEFTFHQTAEPPTMGTGSGSDIEVMQTLIKELPIGSAGSGGISASQLQGPEHAEQLFLLYELSLKLMACTIPDEVVRIALELLQQRTKAAVVGFLWLSDEGQLKPKIVIPEDQAAHVALSESLTELVCKKMHAIWIANQHLGEAAESLEHYADALCVPLVDEGTTLGAIHVYREQKRFRQSHFDFAISVANVVGVALARARRQRSLETDYERLVSQSPGYAGMIGESKPMKDLQTKIARVARVTGCVLIRGESGTGKELVARAIHQASGRADRPMLSVNCAAIPADLMESQLFGHKKGSFTGADKDHSGFFQQADLGTLFLDEVGEMTLEGQAKLLRILEGHPFLPVGSTQEISVDVRVIAATNQDLQSYVRESRFREDLYYRLSVFELVVPPVRDRGKDLALLIDFFLAHYRAQHGRPNLELSDAARAKLLAYRWPGNVRQLRNVIDSSVVLAGGSQIGVDDLMLKDVGSDELESLRIDFWERRLIGEALQRSGGSVPEAAKLLGIGRATLYRKIDDYGLKK